MVVQNMPHPPPQFHKKALYGHYEFSNETEGNQLANAADGRSGRDPTSRPTDFRCGGPVYDEGSGCSQGHGDQGRGQMTVERGKATGSLNQFYASPSTLNSQTVPASISINMSSPRTQNQQQRPVSMGSASAYAPITKYGPFGGFFTDSKEAKRHRRKNMMFERQPYITPSEDPTISSIEALRSHHVERIYNAMTNKESARDNNGSIAMKRWVHAAHYPPHLVEAYAHKVFDCLLDQAKEGFRGWHHNDYVIDDRKGEDEDRDVNCEERLSNVIRALEEEKTICEDVMNSTCQTRMFVNAPRAYANRKYQNRVGNSKRGRTRDTATEQPSSRPAKSRRTATTRQSRVRTTTTSSNPVPRAPQLQAQQHPGLANPPLTARAASTSPATFPSPAPAHPFFTNPYPTTPELATSATQPQPLEALPLLSPSQPQHATTPYAGTPNTDWLTTPLDIPADYGVGAGEGADDWTMPLLLQLPMAWPAIDDACGDVGTTANLFEQFPGVEEGLNGFGFEGLGVQGQALPDMAQRAFSLPTTTATTTTARMGPQTGIEIADHTQDGFKNLGEGLQPLDFQALWSAQSGVQAFPSGLNTERMGQGWVTGKKIGS